MIYTSSNGGVQTAILSTFYLSCCNVYVNKNDDDEWNPCIAAGVCFMLLSSCVEDDIIGIINYDSSRGRE